MNTFRLFTLVALASYSYTLRAAEPGGRKDNPVKVQQFINHKDWNFVENKGQLADPTPSPRQRGTAPNNDIKYYGRQGGVYLYCKPGMLSFVFTKTESDEKISEATRTSDGSLTLSPFGGGRGRNSIPQPTKISTSRTDLILLNSNPNAQIIASDQQEYYENFYTTGDANNGITNVHTFKTVTYRDVYSHIDMVLNCKEQGMEYSFIVHPGGKVSDIQLQWNGLQGIKKLKDSKIEYSLAVGTIEESGPKSFLEGNLVASRFVRNGFNYGFNVGRYDKGKDLVIDPSLSWATYYGGIGGDIGYGVSMDASGNVYVTGSTSSSGIASSGAHQTSYQGNDDAFLVKFNSSGSLVWATYYGGVGLDIGSGISTDPSGNVYVTGYTTSGSGISSSGAHQTAIKGGYDAFLAKFSSSGSLTWATYFGSTSDDFGIAASTDASGNIYVAGYTASNSGISAGTGVYQNYYGGNYDAFLAKFSSSGGLTWATYYGGGLLDIGVGVSTDASGNVCMTGFTSSSSHIAGTGAYQTSYGGGTYDAFLAKFNSSGALVFATYYGGSGADYGNGVSTDVSGNVFMTGYTTSSGKIASSGSYQTSYAGDTDAFLAKFSSSGSLVWATYYGGNGYDDGQGASTDTYGNVYVTGYTTSGGSIASSGGYQTSYGGGSYDAFLAKFNSSGALVFATYYGGSGADYGYGVSTDASGNVFMAGSTASTSGIASSGAYQTSLKGGYDAFLVKFSFPIQNDAGIISIKSPSGTVCAGSQTVKVILENYGNGALTSDSIYWNVNGAAQTPIKWTGSLKTDSIAIVNLGTFNFPKGGNTIVAWSAKPNGIKDSIPGNDTANINFTANALPAASVISSTSICSGNSILIGASSISGSTYSWTGSTTGFSSTSSDPSVSPTSSATYTLTEANSNGCVNSNSVTISVNPLPAASVIPNTAICTGSMISIGASTVSGSSYSWTSSVSGFSSTVSNPSVSPTSTTSYTLTETNSNGCVNSNSLSISVNALPTATVISNATICSRSVISIGASAVSGSSYSWASSVSAFSSTDANPSVSPTSTASYTLTETNSNGCVNSNSVTITVNALPAASVISNTAICIGSAISIGATAVSGSSYSWASSVPGFSSTVANPSVSPTSTSSYTLTETNSKGCVNSNSVTITVNTLPATSVIANTSICTGSAISIGATAVSGSTYSWISSVSGFSSTDANPSVSPTSTSSYTLTEINSNGCMKSNSVTIIVNPLPAASVISNTAICIGSAISIGAAAVAGSTYSWTSSNSGFSSTSANPNVSPKSTTRYYLTETNVYSCKASDSILVTVNPLPDANWSATINKLEITLVPENTTYKSYLWNFGDGFSSNNVSPVYNYAKKGSYQISLNATDANGCSSEHDSTVNITNSSIEKDVKDKFSISVFPNPFHTSATVRYILPGNSDIRLSLYDLNGKLISIISDQKQIPGNYQLDINAEKYSLTPGVYLLKFMVDGAVENKKMVLY